MRVMQNKRYQVFVSSTFEDLKDERREIMQALLELDCMPSGMELFPAASVSQWSLIKRVIDDCDYYIVIIGGRYGTIGPSGHSYTEMEYRYALEKEKPIIAFFHASPGDIADKRSEQDPEGKRRLDAFKSLVKQRLCRAYSSPADLGSQVSRSLINLIRDHPSTGWVRGEELSGSEDAGQVMPWPEYLGQLRSLAERIRQIYSDGRYVPAVVVSISNGGGVFGELLAREVFPGRPLVMLWADRLNKKGVYFENDYNRGLVKAIRKEVVDPAATVNVLVVDDIIASGTTHTQVLGFLKKHLPNASVRFLPMFSRNAKYVELIQEHFLWLHPAFDLSVGEALKIHETEWLRLPYGKEIRSS